MQVPDVIAVDGGGTRCRVACQTGATRVSVETGSCNVTSDFDGALQQIERGLHQLASKLELPLAELKPVPCYLGLAGVTGGAIARKLSDQLPVRHIKVEEDRMPAARGALGAKDGALLHCGTGSFQVVQTCGLPRFAGGWGAILGDEGSAAWLGCQALGAVTQVVDGLREPSVLTQGLLTHFGDAPALVAFASTANAADFGQLAPRVSQAALNGDPIAQGIMRRGADIMSKALDQMGWHDAMPLMLTGGAAPAFAPYLCDAKQAALTAPHGTPLDGAIALAYDFRDSLKA